MLIVEGPDCVGKTTLCKKLLERLPTHVYAHFSRLPPEFDRHWGYVERMSRKIVQDRFHMSEVAYARARGEEPILTYERYRLIDAELRRLGGYTVLVTASQRLITERWRPDQMYSLKKTQLAASVFALIREQTEEVGADVDYSFRCDEETPYVTGHAIDEILEQYLERQRLIDKLCAIRPLIL